MISYGTTTQHSSTVGQYTAQDQGKGSFSVICGKLPTIDSIRP